MQSDRRFVPYCTRSFSYVSSRLEHQANFDSSPSAGSVPFGASASRSTFTDRKASTAHALTVHQKQIDEGIVNIRVVAVTSVEARKECSQISGKGVFDDGLPCLPH